PPGPGPRAQHAATPGPAGGPAPRRRGRGARWDAAGEAARAIPASAGTSSPLSSGPPATHRRSWSHPRRDEEDRRRVTGTRTATAAARTSVQKPGGTRPESTCETPRTKSWATCPSPTRSGTPSSKPLSTATDNPLLGPVARPLPEWLHRSLLPTSEPFQGIRQRQSEIVLVRFPQVEHRSCCL